LGEGIASNELAGVDILRSKKRPRGGSAAGEAGASGNIRRDDLSLDSPYNTYRYAGLPPGPIASPGVASVDAVVHPAESDYLYFVSKNDGSHVFSKTLAEHNQNVQRYQVDYFRAGRAGQAGGAGKAGHPGLAGGREH